MQALTVQVHLIERLCRSHWSWLLPVVVAGLVFGPGLIDAGWVADDAINLRQHAASGDLLGEWTTPTYAHAGGSRGHIWRPLPASLQHLAALLLGREAWVFRLLNILLHLLNVALVIRLARIGGASAGLAGAVGLAWTLHPALPEAVCWSSDVYDLAATSVILLGAGLALAPGPRSRRLAGLAGLVLLAGLCKESAVACVPVLALLGWLRADLRNGLEVLAAASMGALIYLGWHHAITVQSYAAAIGQTPLSHQIQAGLSAAGWLLTVPAVAPMAHLFDPTDWLGPLIGLLTLGLLAVPAGLLWRRQPQAARHLVMALGGWCILLSPAAIAIPLIGIQPFRYAYTPSALAFGLLAGAFAAWPRRFGLRLPVLLLGVWCLSSGLRVIPRISDWSSDYTLWSAELQVEPDNPYAGGSLARALLARGEAGRALALWRAAVERVPPGIRVFDKQSERWLLAQAAFLRGRPDLALEQAQRLIDELEASGRPVPSSAWCLVADSYDRLGQPEAAAAVEGRCGP